VNASHGGGLAAGELCGGAGGFCCAIAGTAHANSQTASAPEEVAVAKILDPRVVAPILDVRLRADRVAS
jgi:hypothetical protein